jgi:hypothetical protein
MNDGEERQSLISEWLAPLTAREKADRRWGMEVLREIADDKEEILAIKNEAKEALRDLEKVTGEGSER